MSRGTTPRATAVLVAALTLGAVPAAADPVRRLAEDVAVAHGLAEAPAATVGDVTRYVLAAPPSAIVFPAGETRANVAAGSDGVLDLAGACPPVLAGRPVVVSVSFGTVASRVLPPTTCRASLPLRVDGARALVTYAPVAVARAAPRRRVETGWLPLPPGAVLRAAIGLADLRATGAPARFRVRAVGRSGHDVTLFSRRLEPAARPGDAGWHEVELPLDAVRGAAGSEVRLVFEARPAGAADLAFPVWGDPAIVSPAARSERLNVVLVSLDTLRADRLGCYGARRATSPAIDRLAADGALFEVAVAAAPHTLASHATMLTGLYPCAHGAGHGGLELRRLPRDVAPLAEVLRRLGWETAAFTENAYLDAGVFQRGFGVFRASMSVNFHQPEGRAEQTIAEARAWLERADRPFFLFVHTYQVHWPYEPPEPYRLFDPAGEPDPHRPDAGREQLARYDGEVRYTDAVLGTLLATLDRLGLRERTVVVVTSDHGEAFGEHGHDKHGRHVHEEDVRVPFVWRVPGVARSGHRVAIPVGLVDVVPTVLDLLGVPPPDGLQGRSLVPLLRGEPPDDALASRALVSESIGAERVAVRAADWKVIFDGPTPQVFLVASDPGERTPVVRPDLVARASAVRDALAASCRERAGAAPGGEAPSRLDPILELKLRALGYLE
jgi:arylsulfatase A-like enzyme